MNPNFTSWTKNFNPTFLFHFKQELSSNQNCNTYWIFNYLLTFLFYNKPWLFHICCIFFNSYCLFECLVDNEVVALLPSSQEFNLRCFKIYYKRAALLSVLVGVFLSLYFIHNFDFTTTLYSTITQKSTPCQEPAPANFLIWIKLSLTWRISSG